MMCNCEVNKLYYIMYYIFIIYVWANEMYLGKKQDIFYTVVICFFYVLKSS